MTRKPFLVGLLVDHSPTIDCRSKLFYGFFIAVTWFSFALQAKAQLPISADLAAIKQVGAEAAGYDAAIVAAKKLAAQPSSSTGELLASMKDASPLAKNWLRMIAADVADNDQFPRDVLLQFFADRSQDTDARFAAYQMLVASEPAIQAMLLEGAADDPSLPIRHAAIAKLLNAAAEQKTADDKAAALKLYRLVVKHGRNPDQLQAAAKALGDLGEKIELADELGLIRRWWAIGTFDNTGAAKFATDYLPEQLFTKAGRLPADWLTSSAVIIKEAGNKEPAATHLVSSDDAFGVISINPTFNKAKDAIAYCYVEFEVPEGIAAVARLGSITASKVWVNGQPVMANEVYHSGSRIDQYTGDCELNQGLNAVLIKMCQNAQTEPWAQDWQFQFRLTDRFGAAIKPGQLIQPPSQ